MNRRLYTADGYFNAALCFRDKAPFIVVIGGRGTGKSYGSLLEAVRSGEDFLYMRRTQTILDIISKPELSPLKALPVAEDYTVKPIGKNVSGIYELEGDAQMLRGYMAALSTFANLRGFNAENVKTIIYDEFIPEKHEKPVKNEFEALLNVYETVDRNRQLQGKDPLKLIMLGNSNVLNSQILSGFGIIDRIVSMTASGQEFWSNGLVSVYLLNDSQISARKAGTALYQLSDSYNQMAIANQFAQPALTIKSYNAKELRHLDNLPGCALYKHKSKSFYYVKKSDSQPDDLRVKALKQKYRFLLPLMAKPGKIVYNKTSAFYALLNFFSL